MTVDVLFQTLQEASAPTMRSVCDAEGGRRRDGSPQFGMTKAWRAMHVLDALLTEHAAR